MGNANEILPSAWFSRHALRHIRTVTRVSRGSSSRGNGAVRSFMRAIGSGGGYFLSSLFETLGIQVCRFLSEHYKKSRIHLVFSCLPLTQRC